MDLVLFIVLIILAFILYNVIFSIQSLIQEMREVKNKCIKINNVPVEEFKVNTANATDTIKESLAKLKTLF